MDKSKIKFLTDLPWVVKSKDEIEIGHYQYWRNLVRINSDKPNVTLITVGEDHYLTDASDWKKTLEMMDAYEEKKEKKPTWKPTWAYRCHNAQDCWHVPAPKPEEKKERFDGHQWENHDYPFNLVDAQLCVNDLRRAFEELEAEIASLKEGK